MLFPDALAAFQKSRGALAPASLRTYHYEMARVARQFEERTLASITLADLETWLSGLPTGLGHNLARRLRSFYRFAHRRFGTPLLAPQTPHKRRGWPSWTEADVDAYRSHWPPGTRQRAIFEAALSTGLRRSDLARLLWQPTGEAGLTQKSRQPIYILPAPADYGPPLKAISLGLALRLWARAAGIHKPPHGLRKLAAQRAAEAGLTGPELCAIFGWSSLRVAEVYVRGSARLAASAKAKLGLS